MFTPKLNRRLESFTRAVNKRIRETSDQDELKELLLIRHKVQVAREAAPVSTIVDVGLDLLKRMKEEKSKERKNVRLS